MFPSGTPTVDAKGRWEAARLSHGGSHSWATTAPRLDATAPSAEGYRCAKGRLRARVCHRANGLGGRELEEKEKRAREGGMGAGENLGWIQRGRRGSNHWALQWYICSAQPSITWLHVGAWVPDISHSEEAHVGCDMRGEKDALVHATLRASCLGTGFSYKPIVTMTFVTGSITTHYISPLVNFNRWYGENWKPIL